MSLAGGWLLVLLPLLAGQTVELPEADGRTRWTQGRLEDRAGEQVWELEVRPGATGWVWVELDSADHGPDLDLTVEPARTDGERRRATSHVGDEALLVAATPGTALLVRVTGPDAGARDAAFRVGVTPLSSPGRTEGIVRGVLDPESGPASRAQLVELQDGDWDAARLLVRRTEGTGDVDLVVLDGRLDPLAVAWADGPEERCQPPLTGLPPRFVLLVVRAGPVTYELGTERTDRGPSRLERFLRELASTPEQRLALEALARTPDFVRMRFYIESYPGGFPLRLRSVPGLRSGGVERFGTYSRGTLSINPAIPAHRDNVQELLDTLVHELVHALLDLPRGPRFPLGLDVLDAAHDPRLRDVADLPIRRNEVKDDLARYLDRDYGPSASDPTRDYSDVNAGAQRLIVKVIEETMLRTGLGRETIVFDSVRARSTRAR